MLSHSACIYILEPLKIQLHVPIRAGHERDFFHLLQVHNFDCLQLSEKKLDICISHLISITEKYFFT